MGPELPADQTVMDRENKIVTCGRCEGHGGISYRDRNDALFAEECPHCHGTGIVVIALDE